VDSALPPCCAMALAFGAVVSSGYSASAGPRRSPGPQSAETIIQGLRRANSQAIYDLALTGICTRVDHAGAA